MQRHFRILLVAFSALCIRSIGAQTQPACVPACANQVRADFTNFGCGSAGDAGCLCSKPDFAFGVRDCSGITCGATDIQVNDYLVGAFCQGQPMKFTSTGVLLAPTSTSGTAASTAATLTTSTYFPFMSSFGPSSASQQPTETSSQTIATPDLASPSSILNSTNSESAPTAPSTTDTSDVAANETTSSDARHSSSGLPQAAVIGIGVGVGIGVLAVVLVAISLLLMKRKRASPSHADISKPIPNYDRTYPGRDHQKPLEKYSHEVELVTNRYEDMVPRQQPRTLV